MQALTRARAIIGPLKDEFIEMAKAAWRRASQDPELFVKSTACLSAFAASEAAAWIFSI